MMSACLVDRFMAEEATEHVRSVLISAIESAPPAGTRYFTFNAFNVLLDFDQGSVTVEDEFDVVAMCRISLVDFVGRLQTSMGGSG